jgi:dethiobiotin synthetase
MLSVFISGLKRQTGKTIVSAGLAATMQSLSYATSFYKPIRTAMGSAYGDLAFMNKTDPNIKLASCYEFECSASPLIGAYKSEVKKIDIAQIVQTYNNSIAMTECHIVEGANSISTPIDDKYTEAEIVKQLGLPLILVVNFKSTTLDEVIMCANYIYTNKIKCFGVILNDYDANNMSVESKYFPHLIKEYTGLKVLGYYPHYEAGNNVPAELLIADTLNNLNIEEIFGLKIAKLAN